MCYVAIFVYNTHVILLRAAAVYYPLHHFAHMCMHIKVACDNAMRWIVAA